MKTLYQSLLFALSAFALAGTAFAQVPSTNDTSTTDGLENTGMGTGALGGPSPANLTGSDNTASGFQALFNNTTGSVNTAFGVSALFSNSTGSDNTASGFNALHANTTGSNNTASGFDALVNNTGSNNTASGLGALGSNTGSNNTAFGFKALITNTTGSSNIAVGFQGGLNLTFGNNDIDIGNVGVAGESNTIRIGTKGTHKATVIAGINTSQVTGSAVYVTTSGRLGVLASSERYKTAITPIGPSTEKLQQLRPVSFHLKADPKGAVQYGLIAEEVAKVYPELVIRNEAGRIEGVRYDELAPMLLNEAQQQQRKMAAQDAKIGILEHQLAELTDLKQGLHAALAKLRSKDELVAQR